MVQSSLVGDYSGNVYVTGESFGSVSGYDYATINYISSGDSLWVARYNGVGNGDDYASSLAVDGSGNVYVTGNSGFDYATIKYSQSVGISQISNSIPGEFSLSQNYPNPFNPVTNLEFGISKLGFVSLKIYDVLGKEVAMLVNANLNPGTYKYNFDASDLQSGVYFYHIVIHSDKLQTDIFSETKKMTLIK